MREGSAARAPELWCSDASGPEKLRLWWPNAGKTEGREGSDAWPVGRRGGRDVAHPGMCE